jgi:hypothetical protein
VLEGVCSTVAHVLIYHDLFAGRSAAHTEDYLLLFGHPHFGFTDHHQHLLIDELAAEFRQEETSAHKQFVVRAFVFERCVFWIYCSALALGMHHVRLT